MISSPAVIFKREIAWGKRTVWGLHQILNHSLSAPPFCWTKFSKKKSRNLKRNLVRNLVRNFYPEIRPEIFRAFLAARKVLPQNFTRFFPVEISNVKSNSKSNFTKNVTNTLLQAWQPKQFGNHLLQTLWSSRWSLLRFDGFCGALL